MLDLVAAIMLHISLKPRETTPTAVRAYYERLATETYGERGWICLDELIDRESRWRLDAANPNSSARGLWQLLRMPEGLDAHQQWLRGSRYLATRYDSQPCKALAHHHRKGWY